MKKHDTWRNTIALMLALLLATPPARAQVMDESALLRAATPVTSRNLNAVEYESSSIPGEVLLSVSVLGAVERPGIYHIPKLTELHKVIAFAGGPSRTANLEGVTISRFNKDKREIVNVDLRHLLAESNSASYTLRPDDIVMVPNDEPIIGQNAVAALGVISTILTIVATSIILSQQKK